MDDTFKKFDLGGKTAYITGGGTGLGFVMARGMAHLGARIMIAGRREEILKASAARLQAETGQSVSYATVDLADTRSVTSAAAHAINALGGVDIFIGNAGQDGLELLEKSTDGTISQLFQVNAIANFSLAKAFLPHMRSKKWGRVILSSSVTSKRGTAHEGMSAYAATKGALNAFVRVAACETGHDNITFNSLILGIFLTDILRGVVEQIAQQQGAAAAKGFMDGFSCMTALGRLGRPDEVEGVVQLLASDAGRYITGAEIPIDGGVSVTMKPNTIN